MIAVNLTLIVKDEPLSDFLEMGYVTRALLLMINLVMFVIGIVGKQL